MACTTANTRLVSNDVRQPTISSAGICPPPVRRFLQMMTRQKHRRALLQLEDHLLEDIGITRKQALLEARKWFWQE